MKILAFRLRIFRFLNFLLFLLGCCGISGTLSAQSGLLGSDTLRIFNGGVWGVYDTMIFSNSMVYTTRTNTFSYLLYTRDGNYKGESNKSHVDGYVEKRGLLPLTFKFPVGHMGKIRPCQIEAPSNTTDSTFSAAYFKENPNNATLSSGPMNVLARGANILAVSPLQYWDINGNGKAKIKLFWEASDNLVALTNNNFADLIIAGWNGTVWMSLDKTSISGILGGSGDVTSSLVNPSAYFAYTFALYNRLPVILNKDTFTLEDNPITLCTIISGKDGSKDTIDYIFCKLPANGAITLINDTCYRYTPNLNFNGKDSICLKVCDKIGNCNIKMLHIDVIPVNDTPIITNPDIVMIEDDSVLICPTIYDPDKFDLHKAQVICGPTNGTTSIVNDTCVRYMPFPDYNGQDTICILICDIQNACDTLQLAITILPIYDSLRFSQETVIASENEDTSFVPYKFDPDGDTVLMAFCNGKDTLSTVHGKSRIVGNKTIFYKPFDNFSGFDTICIIACTKNFPIKCKSLRVPIIILDGRKIIVVLKDDSYILETDMINIPIESDSIRKGILANDVIVPFTNQIFINYETVNGKLNRFNTYLQYIPLKDFEGIDSFQYSMCIQSLCDTALVKIRTSRIYMNMFTPNGDGKNDFFELPILDNYKSAQVIIYNRWGDMVWISTGEYRNNKFAGNSREGSNLPDGTYYYVIKFNDPGREDKADFIEVYR